MFVENNFCILKIAGGVTRYVETCWVGWDAYVEVRAVPQSIRADQSRRYIIDPCIHH
jgi:hypothetical protein